MRYKVPKAWHVDRVPHVATSELYDEIRRGTTDLRLWLLPIVTL